MQGRTHERVVEELRVSKLEDWADVLAVDILAIKGVGSGYLGKLRLWLAHRGFSLKWENAPDYWVQIADAEEPVGACPFTVLVDSNETCPYSFKELKGKDGELLNIPVENKAMWTEHLADYSIKGLEHEIQIERKSLEDLVGTLSGRRENFEREVSCIDGLCSFAAIVCECQWSDILIDKHQHGARAKTVSRTMLSWVVKYPRVHWVMCAGRAHAERATYQMLHNFWWQAQRVESAMKNMEMD